jgi:hypothetical protein
MRAVHDVMEAATMGCARVDGAGQFGDKRLARRGVLFVDRMVEHGSCTMHRIGEGRAEQLGFCRFLGDRKVTVEEIVALASRTLGAAARGLDVVFDPGHDRAQRSTPCRASARPRPGRQGP